MTSLRGRAAGRHANSRGFVAIQQVRVKRVIMLDKNRLNFESQWGGVVISGELANDGPLPGGVEFTNPSVNRLVAIASMSSSNVPLEPFFKGRFCLADIARSSALWLTKSVNGRLSALTIASEKMLMNPLPQGHDRFPGSRYVAIACSITAACGIPAILLIARILSAVFFGSLKVIGTLRSSGGSFGRPTMPGVYLSPVLRQYRNPLALGIPRNTVLGIRNTP